MSKVLKRLYLGDVVKSFGTKQLRKLTTEKPQEDSIIGTWVLNNDIVDVGINPKTYKLNYEISYVDYDTNELITGIVENGDFLWNRVVGENDYYLSIDNTASVNIYYWAGVNSGGSGKHPNVATVTRSGGYCKYIDKTSEVGIALRTIKIIGGTDIYNEDLIAIIKANATKQESIVGTWRLNPNSFDWGEYYPYMLLDNEDVKGKCYFAKGYPPENIVSFTDFTRVGFGRNGTIYFEKFYGTQVERPYSQTIYPSVIQQDPKIVGWNMHYYGVKNGLNTNYTRPPTDEQQQQCCIIEITDIGTGENALIFADLLRKNATKIA